MTAPNAELTARVEAAVRAEREATLSSLGHDPVLWLALVPLWTKSAAEAARFPARPVIDFIQRARRAGWCETRGSLRDGGAPNLRFWMPDGIRRDVLDLLRRYSAGAAPEIAARIARLPGDGELEMPGALRAWAWLTESGMTDRVFLDQVGRAVGSQDLSGARDLVVAGEAIAASRGGTMELAADRARRLLDLGRRRRADGRDLERYLDRPELTGAVDRLLAPDAEQWALHLRGVGGVGKTMLIKYLASGRYAADRGLPPIPLARVDFDYVSPDYPVRRPAQLLLELADELSLHTAGDSRADRALARFRATVTSLHEALSGNRAEPQDVTADPRMLSVIDDFATAIVPLPPMLLILDTCEELAKASTGDPAAPAVRATFSILERIHDRAPSARVLFAGRRPLPERGYLTVREVGGFTREEAQRYLGAFSDPPLSADVKAAMIRQSPAVDDPDRVSPFDLALFLSWADDDPDLTAAAVDRGSDAYVESRIVERLRDPGVLRALPALAVAGRCRVTTVAAFLGADPAVLGPRLAEQEWIDADGNPPVHVAAKPALARRLRRYFEHPDRAAGFTATTARLAEALRAGIESGSLADIDVDELLAALRLSGPTVAAFWLWDVLAGRAKNEGRWSWLLNVSRRVLGESEEDEWPTAAALHATVLASFIAASRRASPLFGLRASWAEVLDTCDAHPDPSSRQALKIRAALGLLPDAPADESLWETLRGASFEDPELSAAAADAAHRLLEAGHDEAALRVLDIGWPPSLSRRRAWFHLLNARANADRRPDAAARSLAKAEHDAVYARPGTERFDWIQPDDLLARIRTEWGLIAPPDDTKLAVWEDYAAAHFDTIDAERLASQCLRVRLARGVIERSVIERWEGTDRYEPRWQPSCSAHDLVPPLFVTLAEARLAVGDPQRALDLVNRRRELALGTRADEETVSRADTELIRLARRLRLTDQRALLTRLAAERTDARLALAVVFGAEDAGFTEAELNVRSALLGLVPRVTRSVDLYRDVRDAMRRAAYVGESYRPPSEVPPRLFAEMAFDEAELLQLRLSDAAARMFGYAQDAYAACGDEFGQALAAARLATITSERSYRASGDQVPRSALRHRRVRNRSRRTPVPLPHVWSRRRTPVLIFAGVVVVGSVSLIGGYLAESPKFSSPRPGPSVGTRTGEPPPSPSATPTSGAPPGHTVYDSVSLLSIIVLVLAVAAVVALAVAWRAFRARGLLTVSVRNDGRPGQGTVRATVRGQKPEYVGEWIGTPYSPVTVRWEARGRPVVGRRWPRRPPTGVIVTEQEEARLTWERGLADSLGPGARRVAWHRRMTVDVRLRPEIGSRAVRFSAPDRWRNLLGPESDIRELRFSAADRWGNILSPIQVGECWVRYAIGRAVTTSGGPRLDLGDAPGEPERLLAGQDLGRGGGNPELIVLQAEPVAETEEVGAGDDLREKLALAVDLIQDGAAPAVLIVPAIPAAHAAPIARAVADHARKRRRDPRRLQAKLRRILAAPDVPPATLDDLVLFVNDTARRE